VGVGADIYAVGGVSVELFGEKPVWEGIYPYPWMLRNMFCTADALWDPDGHHWVFLHS